MELVRKAQASTEEEAKARKRDAEALEAQEVLEKEKIAEETIKKTQKWLADDKQGQRYLQSKMRILIDKSVFKLKMTKKTEDASLLTLPTECTIAAKRNQRLSRIWRQLGVSRKIKWTSWKSCHKRM